MLPLELPAGRRITLTWPSSSIQRSWTSLGMSDQTRYLPTPFQAGPSAQSMPVCRRRMGELPILILAKRLSRTIDVGFGVAHRLGAGAVAARGRWTAGHLLGSGNGAGRTTGRRHETGGGFHKSAPVDDSCSSRSPARSRTASESGSLRVYLVFPWVVQRAGPGPRGPGVVPDGHGNGRARPTRWMRDL